MMKKSRLVAGIYGIRCTGLLIWGLGGGMVLGEVSFWVDSDWRGTLQNGERQNPWRSLDVQAWNTINETLAISDVVIYFSAMDANAGEGDVYDKDGDGLQDGIELYKRVQDGEHRLRLNGGDWFNADDENPRWEENLGTQRALLSYLDSQNGAHRKISHIQVEKFRLVRRGGGKIISIAGDDWVVEGCDLSHAEGATSGPGLLLVPTADKEHEGSASFVPLCEKIVLRGNEIHDTYGELIYLGGGGARPGEAGSGYPSHRNIIVEGNRLYRGGVWGGQGDGIDMKGGLVNVRIRGNEIFNLSDVYHRAIVMQGQVEGGEVQDIVVERNWIHGCSGVEGGAISLVDSWGIPDGVCIRNNVIENVSGVKAGHGKGILVRATRTSVEIFNNTIAQCESFGIQVYEGGMGQVMNNLLYGNGIGSEGIQVNLPPATQSDFNGFVGTWGYPSEGLSSIEVSLEDLVVEWDDPAMVALGWKVPRSVRNAARVLQGFQEDFWGRSRGPQWDIGALEVPEGSVDNEKPSRPTGLRLSGGE